MLERKKLFYVYVSTLLLKNLKYRITEYSFIDNTIIESCDHMQVHTLQVSIASGIYICLTGFYKLALKLVMFITLESYPANQCP